MSRARFILLVLVMLVLTTGVYAEPVNDTEVIIEIFFPVPDGYAETFGEDLVSEARMLCTPEWQYGLFSPFYDGAPTMTVDCFVPIEGPARVEINGQEVTCGFPLVPSEANEACQFHS